MPHLKGMDIGGYVEIDRKVRFKQQVQATQDNPIGDTYYVRDNGLDTNNGKSVEKCFKTLAYAVHHAAGDWDVIKVFASSAASLTAMLETDIPIKITQCGLKILGNMTSQYQWGSPSIHTHATTTLFTIAAHMVEIAGLAIHHQGAGTSIEIAPDSKSFHGWRNHIHHCYFGGNDTALTAIAVGGVGTDAPCTVIEDCYFQGFMTSSIAANCGYGSTIQRCNFVVPAASKGIDYIPDGTSRPFGWILNNRFTTPDSSAAYGIYVRNTPTAGYLFIDGNSFNNFNTGYDMSKHDGYLGVNYINGVLRTT